MLAKNKTIQKFISSFLIISMLAPAFVFFSAPKKAKAIFGFGDIVFDPAHTAVTVKIVAQEILKQFIMTITRKLLDKMTQSTINWINSGFHGNPLYLENPKSFFRDIAKSEVRNLVDMFGYDPNKFPFGKAFALNIISSYKKQLEDNAEHTLSRVINDPALLERYTTDFNTGGWDGFLENTQHQQNNYIGFQMLATEELARRLEGTTENAAQKVRTTLQQGMGFLSPQICPSNPKYNTMANAWQRPSFRSKVPDFKLPDSCVNGVDGFGNPIRDITKDSPQCNADLAAANAAYYAQKTAEEKAWTEVNTCPDGLVSTTPGSVVASQIFTAMSSKQRQGELGAALGNSLAAIFDALINKFMNDAIGLIGLSDKSNPPPEPAVDQNDFLYLGDSINSVRNIQIIPPTTSSRLGTCTTGDQIIPNQTESYCASIGGTWTANETPDETGETSGEDNTENNNPPANSNSENDQISLSTSPWNGSPSSHILTATNSDSGQFYYYFYCDRNETDNSPPVPGGYINSPMLIHSNVYMSPMSCNYGAAGTYHPKVISWRVFDGAGNNVGSNAGAWRQANTTVVVQ